MEISPHAPASWRASHALPTLAKSQATRCRREPDAGSITLMQLTAARRTSGCPQKTASTMRAAHRGASRGLVVIADRYPQNEDVGYNDGPLLPRLTHAPHWLRQFEAHAYTLAGRLPPDLVLKLEVTAETAARREPDMDPETRRQRIEAARRLTFPGVRIVRVDAERPLEEVIRSVKREIWGLL